MSSTITFGHQYVGFFLAETRTHQCRMRCRIDIDPTIGAAGQKVSHSAAQFGNRLVEYRLGHAFNLQQVMHRTKGRSHVTQRWRITGLTGISLALQSGLIPDGFDKHFTITDNRLGYHVGKTGKGHQLFW